MSVPGNINPAPPPSSFDSDPDFFEESRWKKFKRRLIEEPVVPLGCALTVWALVEATKSIRSGDKHRTNRMFRRRIYAQGFTILAITAGSFYWGEDRKKRNEFNILQEQKKRQERQEAWLKELEERDKEEDELRKIREKVAGDRADASRRLKERAKEVKDNAAKTVDAAKETVVEAVNGDNDDKKKEGGSVTNMFSGLWPKS